MTDSKPVILLVTGSLRPGGTEIALFHTALGLQARGRFSPQVSVLAESGIMGEALRRSGVPVHDLRMRGRLYGPAGLACLHRLRGLVRQSRAALVHTFLFDADVLGALAARMSGVRVITTRRAIKKGKEAQLAAYRWTNPLAARIVANSEEVRRFTLHAERAPASKVMVIPNGIETGRLATGDGGRFRANLGVPPSALLVGTLGTVKPVKGQDLLFEATLPLLRARRDVIVVVGGTADTPLGNVLRRRAAQEGVADRFRLLGSLDDVQDCLAALDVFVLPSRSEGMSNALLEAMAAGRCVVATRVGGNAEALLEGKAGRLVPAEDVPALHAAVRDLLEEPDTRARFGAAASARARSEYDLATMLDRLELLYDEIAAHA